MIDRSGTNGLVVGKQAIKYRGCPKCGEIGATPLGTVITVAKLGDTRIHHCGKCKTNLKVTEFFESGGRFGACHNWQPLPDLDETEELKQLEEIEA